MPRKRQCGYNMRVSYQLMCGNNGVKWRIRRCALRIAAACVAAGGSISYINGVSWLGMYVIVREAKACVACLYIRNGINPITMKRRVNIK